MIVVSDTSPISNLILIQRLDILNELYEEIIVPPAVDNEIRALEGLGKNIHEYLAASWIKILTPSDLIKVADLQNRLDQGEAQAITLALELKCGLLLMDERIGTKIAREEGLITIGLVGVLVKAKHSGVIETVAPLLDDLRTKAGFWLGSELESAVLTQVNEA